MEMKTRSVTNQPLNTKIVRRTALAIRLIGNHNCLSLNTIPLNNVSSYLLPL